MKVHFLGKKLRNDIFQNLLKDVDAFSIYLDNCSEQDFLEFYSKGQYMQFHKYDLNHHALLIYQHLEKKDNSFLEQVLEALTHAKSVLFNAYDTTVPINTEDIKKYIEVTFKYRKLQNKLSNFPVQESHNKTQKI